MAVLLDFAQREEMRPESCLAGSGITEYSLNYEDPSLEQELTVINNLIAALPYHPFHMGFKVGRMANAHTFGLMGQALIAAPTIKDITSL